MYPHNALVGNSSEGQEFPGQIAVSLCPRYSDRLGFIFEYREYLLFVNAQKPFDELVNRSTTGEVFVKRKQWNSGACENPVATGFAELPLYCRA